MRILFRPWYHPFNNGWKLCSYQTKAAGYDELSHRLHDFKENDRDAIDAFSSWSIAKLSPFLADLDIDYCVRSLGRAELIASRYRPLNKLARNISEQFGIEFIPQLIAKRRATKHLVTLKKAERETELQDVFYINMDDDLSGSSILVVDDIRTTGTTSTFIRKTILEQFPDVKCYLFVLAQSNDGGNSQEIIDTYSQYC